MTDASNPFLDPDVAARVARMELRATTLVEGMMVGRHDSPFFGHSVEFAQHREYAPGDDLRHIDWKVWARSDRYTIKQLKEETNLRATLLLDVSRSMAYGEGDSNKLAVASSLAAALALVLLRQSDSVGLITFDNDVRSRIPHRSQRKHLRTLLAAMESAQPRDATDLAAVLDRIADQESRRGLVVLVSDLLAERASVMRSLSLLRQRKHDVVVLHVLHDDEIDFPFEGTTRFEGLESDTALICDPKALRDSYRAAMNEYLAELRRHAGAVGVDYRLARTSDRPDVVLARLLFERSQR